VGELVVDVPQGEIEHKAAIEHQHLSISTNSLTQYLAEALRVAAALIHLKRK
jgi:phosphoenolpyruvate-protein kinase (PTS system EI component)